MFNYYSEILGDLNASDRQIVRWIYLSADYSSVTHTQLVQNMPPTEKVKKKREEGEGGVQEKGKEEEEGSIWWGAFILSILLTLATRLYKVNQRIKPKFRSFLEQILIWYSFRLCKEYFRKCQSFIYKHSVLQFLDLM